jgi:hypothetical protein
MPDTRQALTKTPRPHPAEAAVEVPANQPNRKITEPPETAGDLIQFSFRAPRELRKRANRASAELEIPVQQLVTDALDRYLKDRGF